MTDHAALGQPKPSSGSCWLLCLRWLLLSEQGS